MDRASLGGHFWMHNDRLSHQRDVVLEYTGSDIHVRFERRCMERTNSMLPCQRAKRLQDFAVHQPQRLGTFFSSRFSLFSLYLLLSFLPSIPPSSVHPSFFESRPICTRILPWMNFLKGVCMKTPVRPSFILNFI